jgi:hypothetical protein
MDASVIIATAAVSIAVVTPVIQFIYGRKKEWHYAREALLKSMSSIYEEINYLVENPHIKNHISYMFCLKQRLLLLDHFKQRYILKQNIIDNVRNIIVDKLMELPSIPKYEEMIIVGKNVKNCDYLELLNEVRGSTIDASIILMER